VNVTFCTNTPSPQAQTRHATALTGTTTSGALPVTALLGMNGSVCAVSVGTKAYLDVIEVDMFNSGCLNSTQKNEFGADEFSRAKCDESEVLGVMSFRQEQAMTSKR
jgi:hypothetical protein